MNYLNNRKYKIIFIGDYGVKRYTQIKAKINIKRMYNNSGNSIKIDLYNIIDDSLKLIINSTNFEVYCGYESGPFSLAFSGSPYATKTGQRNADSIVTVVGFDGSDVLSRSLISYTGEKGIPVRDVIEAAATNAKMPLYMADGIGDRRLKSGFSFYGSAKDMLESICHSSGLQYSVQNQTIQVTRKGETTTRPSVLLSMETGLIRYIDRTFMGPRSSAIIKDLNPADNPYLKELISSIGTEEGVQVYSLMRADINPGDPVWLPQGKRYEKFRVDTIEHNGDTMPVENSELGTWTSTINLISLKQFSNTLDKETRNGLPSLTKAIPVEKKRQADTDPFGFKFY
ncbi:hypothetical protein [Granulibacter bethesdensis]|uniref:hypothetical protein n=1 Tax=Granulibacter bethesdensis TaxID=364410 RepID=UPI00090B0FC4|nr:hypothetical protein [Granulibacter bethesdensis]APH59895.1 Hypothetical protein GbCGDNIH7_1555 [Granulibacter bethesdensis]